MTTISHEFRTPLSTLIAELELAKELNITLDDYKISIDNALQDANHASGFHRHCWILQERVMMCHKSAL